MENFRSRFLLLDNKINESGLTRPDFLGRPRERLTGLARFGEALDLVLALLALGADLGADQ